MTDRAQGPLAGIRVIEVASFIAGPSAGLTLRQLGADVIRVDPVGGAPDIDRWPLAESGRSLYWAGLNRGKRSVELDLGSDAGRARLQDLVAAPGPGAGILLTNLSGKSWLSDDLLRAARPDLIHVQVLGTADGEPAVDYTVNASVGLPYATGPQDGELPVNHALPAWDLICGQQAAVAILAGLHRRQLTGEGTHSTVALADVAVSTLTTLGMLTEAALTGVSRPPYGNAVYGSFGIDLATSDGARVMVVALTPRQWSSLLEVTGTTRVVAAVAAELDADFGREGDRWIHRDVLAALIRPWFAARSLAEVTAALAGTHVLWAPYRHLAEVAEELTGTTGNPVVTTRDDPGLGEILATTGAIRFPGSVPGCAAPAPALGEHTDDVLEDGSDRSPAPRR
jgi:2-methylfumaryl-CoA isomerase